MLSVDYTHGKQMFPLSWLSDSVVRNMHTMVKRGYRACPDHFLIVSAIFDAHSHPLTSLLHPYARARSKIMMLSQPTNLINIILGVGLVPLTILPFYLLYFTHIHTPPPSPYDSLSPPVDPTSRGFGGVKRHSGHLLGRLWTPAANDRRKSRLTCVENIVVLDYQF
jgi:hypothetical protein